MRRPSAPEPVIDCAVCRHWALHTVRDTQPAYVFGDWHHPAHADDLLHERSGARIVVASVRLPDGNVLAVDSGSNTEAIQ